MKNKIIILGLVGLVTISNKAISAEQVGNAEWKQRMQSMLSDVLKLTPYAFDEKKFNDKKNATVIKNSLISLSKHSTELSKHTSRLNKTEGLKIDPSFPFIAEAFQSELSVAQTNFDSEASNHAQTQSYLKSALSKCILCHTQSSIGPALKIDQFKKEFAILAPQDRYMALAATRQFDEALIEFAKILRDQKEPKTDAFTMDNEIKAALAITVRVKMDPKETLKLINEIIDSKAGSKVLQSDLNSWKKSALEWTAEKKSELNTDESLFVEANRLVEKSKKTEFSLDTYDNASITLLRASSHLHDLLTNHPTSPLRAKCYMLLASIYDMLPGFAVWDLPDEYLGACIKENPHSEAGEKCYEEYKKLIILGYSGSSGTHIPWPVRKHLETMKELAKPEVVKKAEPSPKK